MTPTPSPSPSPSPSPTARPPRFPTPQPTPITTPSFRSSTTLKDIAAPKRYFGTAVQSWPLQNDDRYASIVESDFSSITPEYAMRWNYVERVQGEPDYQDADDIITWAASRHIAVRGFPLAWNQALPGWLTAGKFDKAALTQILHDHITGEVSHFAGKVVSWDVVTDPLTASGALAPSIWSQTLGSDWIAQVLQWAHTADPSAKLYINTAGETLGAQSDAMFNLVSSLKARNIPLDGVGLEGHFDASKAYPIGQTENIQRLGALGLEVAITQLDVRVHNPPLEKGPPEGPRQLKIYTALIRSCFTQPACVGVTVWEFSDRYSWVPAAFPGYGLATLFNANGRSKPELLVPIKQAMLP